MPEKLRLYFEKLLVIDKDVLLSLSRQLAQYVDMPAEFVLLFYYDYTQNTAERRGTLEQMKEELVKNLARLLFANKIISPVSTDLNDEISYLAKTMMAVNDFNLVEINNQYNFYRKLYDDTQNLATFLYKERIIRNVTISFDVLVDHLKDLPDKSRFIVLTSVTTKLIKESSIIKFSKEETDALIASSMVLFLVDVIRDPLQNEACRQASVSDLAVKILYASITTKEEEGLRSAGSTLYNVVDNVFNGKFVNFNKLVEFKAELSKGTLYPSMKELFGVKLDSINEGVKKITDQDKLTNLLERVTGAIRSMLNTEIDNDFVIQALNSQLISAYMITSSEGPIMKVVDECLDRACSRLSINDHRYKGLFIRETEERTKAGKSTRVGLVPLNIRDFDEFTALFDNVFKLASNLYKAERGGNVASNEFSAHLIRIFPSESAFKLVSTKITKELTEEHPVNSIRRLIINNLGSLDRIRIAASANESEPTTALKNTLFSLFDNYTGIYMMTRDLIEDIVNSKKGLPQFMGSEEFDKEIKDAYSASTLTQLAIKLHRMLKTDEEATKMSFREKIASLLGRRQISLDQNEIQRLSIAVLTRLTDLGLILESGSTIGK